LKGKDRLLKMTINLSGGSYHVKDKMPIKQILYLYYARIFANHEYEHR